MRVLLFVLCVFTYIIGDSIVARLTKTKTILKAFAALFPKRTISEVVIVDRVDTTVFTNRIEALESALAAAEDSAANSERDLMSRLAAREEEVAHLTEKAAMVNELTDRIAELESAVQIAKSAADSNSDAVDRARTAAQCLLEAEQRISELEKRVTDAAAAEKKFLELRVRAKTAEKEAATSAHKLAEAQARLSTAGDLRTFGAAIKVDEKYVRGRLLVLGGNTHVHVLSEDSKTLICSRPLGDERPQGLSIPRDARSQYESLEAAVGDGVVADEDVTELVTVSGLGIVGASAVAFVSERAGRRWSELERQKHYAAEPVSTPLVESGQTAQSIA